MMCKFKNAQVDRTYSYRLSTVKSDTAYESINDEFMNRARCLQKFVCFYAPHYAMLFLTTGLVILKKIAEAKFHLDAFYLVGELQKMI